MQKFHAFDQKSFVFTKEQIHYEMDTFIKTLIEFFQVTRKIHFELFDEHRAKNAYFIKLMEKNTEIITNKLILISPWFDYCYKQFLGEHTDFTI